MTVSVVGSRVPHYFPKVDLKHVEIWTTSDYVGVQA
jgi:hypothetical protein